MKLRNFWVALLVTTSMAVTGFGKGKPGGGGGKVQNLPITTDLETNDTAGYVADIQNEGLGPYFDGVDSVTSFLTTNGYNGIVWGDWQFGTLNSSTRKVTFSFTKGIPIEDGGTAVPNPPFSVGNVTAHIEDKCTAIMNSMLEMTTGQSMTCPVAIHFFAPNGDEYKMGMSPNSPGFAETTFVWVTCNNVDSAGCKDWFIEPIPTSEGGDPNGAIGRLNYIGCTGNKTHCSGNSVVTENRGDYYFRFHFHLTRP